MLLGLLETQNSKQEYFIRCICNVWVSAQYNEWILSTLCLSRAFQYSRPIKTFFLTFAFTLWNWPLGSQRSIIKNECTRWQVGKVCNHYVPYHLIVSLVFWVLSDITLKSQDFSNIFRKLLWPHNFVRVLYKITPYRLQDFFISLHYVIKTALWRHYVACNAINLLKFALEIILIRCCIK